MKKLKQSCRRCGISMVAMLSLLGVSALVHNANADSTQVNTNQKTYPLINLDSVQPKNVAYNVSNNQATNDHSTYYENNENNIQNNEQSSNSFDPAAMNRARQINQNFLHSVHSINPQAYQEAQQTNQNFLHSISSQSLQQHLNQPVTNMQSARETVANNTRPVSLGSSRPVTFDQQLFGKGYSDDQTQSQDQNDYPDDEGFSAFLNEVNDYVKTHVQGNQSDVTQAEESTDQDAKQAFNRYENNQSTKYEQKTHASAQQVVTHRRHSEKRLMRKFGKLYNLAKSQLGKPYAWGGNGPTAFDCSGFTKYIYHYGFHKELPRTVGEQYNATKHVSYRHARLGDLLFFNNFSHVGVYLGHGLMIDAQLRGVIVEKVRAPWWTLDAVGRVIR